MAQITMALATMAQATTMAMSDLWAKHVLLDSTEIKQLILTVTSVLLISPTVSTAIKTPPVKCIALCANLVSTLAQLESAKCLRAQR
jgi:hypothetical protein